MILTTTIMLPKNLDKLLKEHPEHIDVLLIAFQMYASQNEKDYAEALSSITSLSIDNLKKRYKKYKRDNAPYGSVNSPCSSYSYFMKENYHKIKHSLGDGQYSLADVSKAVSQTWKHLDKKAKKKYEKLAEKDKERYVTEKDNIKLKLDNNNINKPKRPQSGFFFYLAEVRPIIKSKNPSIKTVDIAKEGKNMWNNLSHNNKLIYKKMADNDKQRYAKEKLDYDRQLLSLSQSLSQSQSQSL
jgi:hypothetical protein